MNWKDLTLYQYQRLIEANEIQHPIDRLDRQIAIVNNWTATQVDNLSVEKYNEEVKRLEFLNVEPEGNPVKYIDVNGKRYKCVYDVRKMPSARYLENKAFQTDLVANLHKLAASMVLPMKRTLWGWKVDKYDTLNHSIYAEDMEQARFVDVYHSIVFFYHVYRIWIEVSRDYLKEVAKKKGIAEAEKAIADFLSIMDGNIQPHKLQNTIVSRLAKHITYRP
jgi:hypothetical protein